MKRLISERQSLSQESDGEMKPGRELDVLVADKVMGYEQRLDQSRGVKQILHEPPYYSTDIAAAFFVCGCSVLNRQALHVEKEVNSEQR